MNIREKYINTASSVLREDDEEVFTTDRVNAIVREATDAFWAKVAELIPESESGDMDPIAEQRFMEAADKAVRTWINFNVTGDPVM